MSSALFSDPVFLALATVGVFLTGISKSGFAGGAGVIAVPLMALVVSPTTAVILMLPLLLLMDAQTITYHRRKLAFSELQIIVPTALIGVLVGSLLLGRLSDGFLQFIIGFVSLVFAALQLKPRTEKAQAQPSRPLLGGVMGLTAGMTSSLIHAGGPPLNIYLATRALPRALWISTAAVFFACINFSKVFSYAWVGLWDRQLFLLSLCLVPIAVLGVYVGHRIQMKISELAFVRVVMIALALSGIGLIAKSLSDVSAV